MPDYQNGKIYKLVNDENDDVYYGSTTQPLPKRLGDHKIAYRRYLNGKGHFYTSFNIVKYPSCKIILVENFPCNSKYELEARERYYIENYNCVNKNKPAMTNTLVDYKNSKIYKIINDENDDEYYGSTTQPLKERLDGHKKSYKRYLNGKSEYMSSFEILKYSSCRIELVENFPCNSRYELEVRESYYIKNFKCVNKMIPRRSKKQYYQDNKEKVKQYNHDNKERINVQRRRYRKVNREKINEKRRQFYQRNKERLKEKGIQYYRQYYDDNKEKVKEKQRQYYHYRGSWGGDERSNNNLLLIDIHLFT